MKKVGVLFLLIILHSNLNSQIRSYFAIGLIPGPNSTLLSFAIVKQNGNKFMGTQQITEQHFMYYALGHWPSKINSGKKDFFKENKVPNCYLNYSKSGKVIGFNNYPIHQLWKLKYKNHPMSRTAGDGWSQGDYIPSRAQAQYLFKNYGVLSVKTNYFIGLHLFKLLKDIQNEEWIENYKHLVEEN